MNSNKRKKKTTFSTRISIISLTGLIIVIPFLWINSFRSIFGNGKGKELQKLGSSFDESEMELIPLPLGLIGRSTYDFN